MQERISALISGRLVPLVCYLPQIPQSLLKLAFAVSGGGRLAATIFAGCS